ncbi:MAG: peptide deformylase [Verrucomicrobiota bacterium]
MVLRVTRYGESVLKAVGAKVTAFDAELKQLADDMVETMRAEEGIGLAAQQVDQALQLFVVELPADMEAEALGSYLLDGKQPPLELIMPLVAINPELELSGDDAPYEEGCLSFPEIRGVVERPLEAKMKYQDVQGGWHELICGGLFARVLQHEYDHLQGVLFTERMRPGILRPLEAKIRRLRKETRAAQKAD